MGCFDPYSDDPRLGIQKIHLCKYSGYLTVAGTAGQVWSHPGDYYLALFMTIKLSFYNMALVTFVSDLVLGSCAGD